LIKNKNKTLVPCGATQITVVRGTVCGLQKWKTYLSVTYAEPSSESLQFGGITFVQGGLT